MIRAGRQDRKIVIERVAVEKDAIGHPIETWSTHLTVWAEYIPISGNEVFRSGRETASESARFVVRYDDITPKDRINYNSGIWDIQHVREIGRRAGLELLAERPE